MNLPNKLTVLRVILIPFFVFFLLGDYFGQLGDYIALTIFVIASLTDMLDGKIARKYNLVTNFGKFMDPLADKLLVCSAMICLIDLRRIPSWVVIIIIAREFIISGFRLVAADKGVVIAAGWTGKVKTVFQMAMVILMIIHVDNSIYHMVELVVMYIALALTIVSLIEYLSANIGVLRDDEASDKETALENELVAFMAGRGLTITTAESCTGGLISGRIINAPGASACVKEAYVTYSNEAKEKLLGVSHDTLESYGAVSEETAAEMANGAAKAACADIALAATGVAGPDGGSKEKPVGLVYIGCYVKGEVTVKKCLFKGNREANRKATVDEALNLLRECLDKLN